MVLYCTTFWHRQRDVVEIKRTHHLCIEIEISLYQREGGGRGERRRRRAWREGGEGETLSPLVHTHTRRRAEPGLPDFGENRPNPSVKKKPSFCRITFCPPHLFFLASENLEKETGFGSFRAPSGSTGRLALAPPLCLDIERLVTPPYPITPPSKNTMHSSSSTSDPLYAFFLACILRVCVGVCAEMHFIF